MNPEIQAFVDAALVYFDMNLGKDQIHVGEPINNVSVGTEIYEYTGIITISGDRTGEVYFSSPADLIRHLLVSMGETEISDELVADLVGEIANSIAGNAKSVYGNGFSLSIPTILRNSALPGRSDDDRKPYIIPLLWRGNTSNIAVWLK